MCHDVPQKHAMMPIGHGPAGNSYGDRDMMRHVALLSKIHDEEATPQ